MREVKFYSGAGAPAVAPAMVGDVYMDTATGTLYTAAQFGATPLWVQTLPLAAGASATGTGTGNPGIVSSFRFVIPAGGGGAPDDVALFTLDLPATVEVIGGNFLCVAAVALSTVEVRNAAGGAGNPITGQFATAVLGMQWNEVGAASAAVAPAGSSWFLRRSDSGVAGILNVLVRYL